VTFTRQRLLAHCLHPVPGFGWVNTASLMGQWHPVTRSPPPSRQSWCRTG